MAINKQSFLNSIKKGVEGWKNLPSNLKKPPEPIGKDLVSPERFRQIRSRNKQVQEAQAKLKEIQEKWELYKKYRGSKIVTIQKPPDGSLYEAEQALKRAKELKP